MFISNECTCFEEIRSDLKRYGNDTCQVHWPNFNVGVNSFEIPVKGKQKHILRLQYQKAKTLWDIVGSNQLERKQIRHSPTRWKTKSNRGERFVQELITEFHLLSLKDGMQGKNVLLRISAHWKQLINALWKHYGKKFPDNSRNIRISGALRIMGCSQDFEIDMERSIFNVIDVSARWEADRAAATSITSCTANAPSALAGQ